ncbi:alanine racemase [Ectobacillus funiculus]|uniref:alanine racemase n=1 Tax=Ectobacillus funiculus TaxID=137993 RepID=UPI00101BF55A|nr:alanine racemase [Ectobacillus funiculus]
MNSYRDTWAEISLCDIEENMTQFREFVQKHTKLMAVVKADGYGHGAIEVAKAVIRAGASYLGVAILDEALQLRGAGISHPIIVLGYTPVRSVATAISANITLTVFNDEVLEEVIQQSTMQQQTACIHLKVDTGMSRIGVTSAAEALMLAQKAISAPFIKLEGIFTHFANADAMDKSYTYKQFHTFLQIIEVLKQHNIEIPLKHCCNSAAAMRFPEMHLDMVRIGIALYGLCPDVSLREHPIKLKQAMSLKMKIAAVKTVPPWQPISYGCTSIHEEKRQIATLPIGYADGISRSLSNQGGVLVQESFAPITGRICMDQMMIDVTHLLGCQPGEEAVLFGRSGYAFQSIDTIADIMGTIHYEVVCLIGKRVPRVYVYGNDLADL